MLRALRSLTRFAALPLVLSTVACASEPGLDAPEPAEVVEVGTVQQALSTSTRSGYLNVAQGRNTTTSSTGWGGAAARAVDGNTSGNYWDNSVTHTNWESSPWWQVTLAGARPISIVTVWNRTDCCSERLAGAVVELLDGAGNVVASRTLATASIPTKQDLYFGGATAVSVRVRLPRGGYLSLAEVQVWMAVPAAQTTSAVAEGICWKQTYGRGVGTIPTECASGEKSGLLCYPACAAGYKGVGPVCWEQCPAGYTDDGAFCRKDARIIGANTSSCPWYDVCGLTFSRGCSTCPAGYINDGCTCRQDAHIFAKKSYGRGVGSPMTCSSDKVMDAGLCYSKCDAKYEGVGPVCWATCGGDYPMACGAACATSPEACANGLMNMATTTIEAIANISGMVASFGSSAAAISSVRTVAMTATAKAAVKTAILNQLRKQAGNLAESTLEGIANGLTGGLENGTFDWTALDPTGIAAVVNAFNQPLCAGIQ